MKVLNSEIVHHGDKIHRIESMLEDSLGCIVYSMMFPLKVLSSAKSRCLPLNPEKINNKFKLGIPLCYGFSVNGDSSLIMYGTTAHGEDRDDAIKRGEKRREVLKETLKELLFAETELLSDNDGYIFEKMQNPMTMVDIYKKRVSLEKERTLYGEILKNKGMILTVFVPDVEREPREKLSENFWGSLAVSRRYIMEPMGMRFINSLNNPNWEKGLSPGISKCYDSSKDCSCHNAIQGTAQSFGKKISFHECGFTAVLTENKEGRRIVKGEAGNLLNLTAEEENEIKTALGSGFSIYLKELGCGYLTPMYEKMLPLTHSFKAVPPEVDLKSYNPNI